MRITTTKLVQHPPIPHQPMRCLCTLLQIQVDGLVHPRSVQCGRPHLLQPEPSEWGSTFVGQHLLVVVGLGLELEHQNHKHHKIAKPAKSGRQIRHPAFLPKYGTGKVVRSRPAPRNLSDMCIIACSFGRSCIPRSLQIFMC